MNTYANKRVCVVGAGVAGLVTAKVLKDDGFEVVIFEKESAIGGVWAPSRTYPGLRTNGPRETYAFSDFPYPETTDNFPTAEQVRSYLALYVEHFGLTSLIHLATEVVSVSYPPQNSGEAQSRFRITVRPTDGSGAEEIRYFDFVVICNGVFSEPHLPHVEGMERFAGQVLHSSQLTEVEVVDGQRVIVVGAGKSALDCATLAARQAQSCTLVFRTPHWMAPRYFFGLIRMDRLLLTRFSELFLRYHRPSRLEAFLHSWGKPFVRLFWQAQGWLISRLLKIPPLFMPEHSLPRGFESIGVGGEFYEVLRQGRLVAKQARITSFTDETAVELDTGERIDADVVIFATGWRQDVTFLDADLRSHLWKNGYFHLYRHILLPDEPHLGFVGYTSSLVSPFTSEIAAHWLSQCFRGELTLPSRAEMEREIAQVHQWTTEMFPARKEGYFIGAYVAHYIDELMRDMGLRTVRTGNLLTEYFARFLPERYRAVGEERRRARSVSAAPARDLQMTGETSQEIL
jgi:dimethylaniline monooxygenase (N-oxide forming)